MNIFLIMLFMTLQVFDVWITKRILANGGKELNPLVRWAMAKTERWWVWKLAIAAVLIILVATPLTGWIRNVVLGGFCMGMTGLVFYNYRVLRGQNAN